MVRALLSAEVHRWFRAARYLSLLGLCAAVLQGCVSHSSYRDMRVQAQGAESVPELSGVPFFPQEQYQCGPAAVATLLNWAGQTVTPEALVEQIYIAEREGSLQVELQVAARRHGLLAYAKPLDFTGLLQQLQEGVPVLVLQNLGLPWSPTWHYAVVVGYQADEEQVLLRSGATRLQQMPLRDFARTWHYADYWALTVHQPGQIPIGAQATPYLRAAVGLERAQRIKEAQAAYRAATAQWPEQDLAWMGLGNAYYQLQDYPGAEQAYRQALSLTPEHPAPAHNLAWALIRQGREAEALAYAEQAASEGESSYQSALQALLEETPVNSES